MAVFSAPWSAPPPSSELSQAIAAGFAPYVKGIAMDNGYRFFAPDPGPSHLIRYEWEAADGTTTKCQFPDLERHYPRLLYHRHFMLAEMIYTLSFQTLDADSLREAPRSVQMELAESQKLVQLLVAGIVRSLFREHPQAVKLRLFLVTHVIPSPQDLEGGATLLDPRGYLDPVPLGEFERGKPLDAQSGLGLTPLTPILEGAGPPVREEIASEFAQGTGPHPLHLLLPGIGDSGTQTREMLLLRGDG